MIVNNNKLSNIINKLQLKAYLYIRSLWYPSTGFIRCQFTTHMAKLMGFLHLLTVLLVNLVSNFSTKAPKHQKATQLCTFLVQIRCKFNAHLGSFIFSLAPLLLYMIQYTETRCRLGHESTLKKNVFYFFLTFLNKISILNSKVCTKKKSFCFCLILSLKVNDILHRLQDKVLRKILIGQT